MHILNIVSVTVKQQAYTSLVRPAVEYANSVWNPYETGIIKQLEMVLEPAV